MVVGKMSSGTDRRSGSGLGLYVVHRLVRNLGGRIFAESEGRDRGTTMHIQLPLGAADGARGGS